jgi:Na+/H+ antiporter NhaA
MIKPINETLMRMVKKCVFNQSQDYWLLSDALTVVFFFSIAMKVKAHVIQAEN